MGFKKATVIWFFLCIFIFSLLTLWLPKKSFSEEENRTLAMPTAFTLSGYFDGSFLSQSEQFLKDHILFRQDMVSFKTSLLKGIGAGTVNDVIIAKGGILIENITVKNGKIAAANTATVKRFIEKYPMLKPTAMIIPTAQAVYPEKNPRYLDVFNQNDYIQYIYSGLPCQSSDAYTALLAAKNDYIFYNTHANWTSIGAYTGYTALAKELGYKPAAIDTFNIEHASNSFLGSIYSKVLYKKALCDHIDLYHYTKREHDFEVIKYTDKNTQTYQDIYFYDYLKENNQDKIFLGDNAPVTKIVTSNKSGKKLLIFKDDTANAMMQFLPIHYSEIVLVDLKYLTRPLDSYIDLKDYPQVLFMYSLETFLNDTNIKKIEVL